MGPPQRFTVVDALRGVAALLVVLYHASEGAHIPTVLASSPRALPLMLQHGNLGVAIFFVLSGFVIAHSIYDVKVTLPTLGRFMLRRAMRLDPPYWAAIALTLAFGFLSAFVLNKTLPTVSTPQVIAHLFYLQDMLRYPSISGVFWTLCLEVQFYFIYVAILALIGYDPTQPRGRAVCALSVAVIISLMWAAILPAPWPGSFLPLWHTFLLGVAAYWAWRVPLLRPYFLIFSAVVTVIAFTKGDNFPLVSATTAILLWAVTLNGSIFTALNWRWLQFLGLISYSLYLIHNPVTGATFRVGYMLTGRSLGTELLWWMVSVGFCMLAAWAMWWALERTGIKLARKISLQPRTVSFN